MNFKQTVCVSSLFSVYLPYLTRIRVNFKVASGVFLSSRKQFHDVRLTDPMNEIVLWASLHRFHLIAEPDFRDRLIAAVYLVDKSLQKFLSF